MIGEITTIWTAVTTWFVENISAVQPIFYADNKITFIGTLCVVTVAVGVTLLSVRVIQGFLKLRG